ncbi:MAG: segregation/condensation protein A [Candidatus Diapherotrites archaeon]
MMLSENSPSEAQFSEPVDLVELIHVPDWKTILIDLIKTEQMDPWSIDISELAEKYLQKIRALEQENLRLPANAILASAILLKFKAKKLHIASIEELEELAEAQLENGQQRLFDPFIPELRQPRMLREGKVSLEELVAGIETILQKSKRKDLLGKSLKNIDFMIPATTLDIEAAQEEVLKAIANNLDSTGLCRFSSITLGKPVPKIVDSFIALLFLTNKGKINAWQDEWFGEIFISLNNI